MAQDIVYFGRYSVGIWKECVFLNCLAAWSVYVDYILFVDGGAEFRALLCP